MPSGDGLTVANIPVLVELAESLGLKGAELEAQLLHLSWDRFLSWSCCMFVRFWSGKYCQFYPANRSFYNRQDPAEVCCIRAPGPLEDNDLR